MADYNYRILVVIHAFEAGGDPAAKHALYLTVDKLLIIQVGDVKAPHNTVFQEELVD